MPISKAGMMGGIAMEPYSTPEELYFLSREGTPEDATAGIFHTDPLLGGEPEKLAKTYTAQIMRLGRPVWHRPGLTTGSTGPIPPSMKNH